MNDLVQLSKNEAVCSSLDVAKKFGKRHDKLLHEIICHVSSQTS